MARIRPSWTPESADFAFSSRTLGHDIVSTVNLTVSALWWYHPVGGAASTAQAFVWDQASTTLLASSDVVNATGWSAGWQSLPLTATLNATASTVYTIGVGVLGNLGFDGDDLGSDITDAGGHVTAKSSPGGRFVNGSASAYPNSSFGGMFGVDLEFEVDSGIEVPVGMATETDSGFSFGRVKTRAIGTATDTSSAFTFGRRKGKLLGIAAEADTALTLGGAEEPVGASPPLVSSTVSGRHTSSTQGRLISSTIGGRL